MRTLESYRKEEQRLRKMHTDYFERRLWLRMQSAGRKLIRVLNKIKELESK